MSKKSKISDNPTAQELLEQKKAFEALEAIYNAVPFSKKIFPKLENTFKEFSNLKSEMSIIHIPDDFNEIFSKHGWIAYESMNLEVMKQAIEIHNTDSLKKAEEFLTDSYDEETLKWGIIRFNGQRDFRRRIRLFELAKDDYLSERYHSCIPLLLSQLDGLVNDISRHVGFFAKNIDLTAWDCIAAHESGLQTLTKLLTKGRNKTNEEPISIPYRNGILHGRDLAYDNKLVAAKSWAAVFAARDWAKSLEDGKKELKPKEELSWEDLFSKRAETNKLKKAVENWKPRKPETLMHLPMKDDLSNFPENSPEKIVGLFIDDWCKKRYGLIAKRLLYFTDTPMSKRAGLAREDFANTIPNSFEIISVEDQAPAISIVNVCLEFKTKTNSINKNVSVRAVYQDEFNEASVCTKAGGTWKIVQNSFSDILYNTDLSQ